MCGVLSAFFLEEADRFRGHFGVLFIRAARVRGHTGRSIRRFYKIVAEQVVLDFLTRDIGEHHTVEIGLVDAAVGTEVLVHAGVALVAVP